MQRARRSLGAAILGLAVLTAGVAFPAALAAGEPAAEAMAPPPSGLPEAVRVVAAVLELTPEQVAAWSQILAAEQEALRPLLQQIHQRRQVLAALLASENPPPPAVGQLVIEIHALEAQVRQVRAQAVAQFRQLLAPPQNLKLEQVRRAAPVCAVVPAFVATGLVP